MDNYHRPDLDLKKIRKIISNSVKPVRFEPAEDRMMYYRRYEKITGE